MKYVIKELDMNSLQEEILHKCGKKTEALILPDETENDKEHKKDLFEEDIASIETEKTKKDKLLFEDVLAEKRRKYTTKQEFIYSLYNNILPAFVAQYILYDAIYNTIKNYYYIINSFWSIQMGRIFFAKRISDKIETERC